MKDASVITLYEAEGHIAERYQYYAQNVLELMKRMIDEHSAGRIIIQAVVPLKKEKQLFACCFRFA